MTSSDTQPPFDELRAPRKIEGRFSARKIIDMIFGALVMGTVGVLIGMLMGSGLVPVAGGIGVSLGAAVGFFGGRRFLMSILIGTVGGGALAWAVAGVETVSVGAGAGAAMGGFFGVWISMVLDMWTEHKRARTQLGEVERHGK